MRRYFFSLMLANLFVGQAMADQPRILLRFIEATWCGPCQVVHQSLIDGHYIKQSKNKAYSNGGIIYTIDDQKIFVQIETVQTNLEDSLSQLNFRVPLSQKGIRYIPTAQIYFDGKLEFQGFLDQLAQKFGVNYNGDVAAIVVKSMHKFIDTKREALAIKPPTPVTSPTAPIRLVNTQRSQFYTLAQVCDYSRAHAPGKNALVVAKTHNCDGSTQVCIKTSALISDPANKLLQDNFVVFATRFQEHGENLVNSGEEDVRAEWHKNDSNPEYYVIDVNQCKVIFRDYAYTFYNQGMFAMDKTGQSLDFEKNYVALRAFLLQKPEVVALLGNKYTPGDKNQIAHELAEIRLMRQQGYLQPTIKETFSLLDAQDRQLGLETE